MCFTAYFDESGTDDASPVVGVGGFLALSEMWESYDQSWREMLGDLSLPFWRQSSFAHSRKQFAGWNQDEQLRRERLARAISIINDNVLASVGLFIRKGDYYKYVSPAANARVGGPYGMAANMLWLELAPLLDLIGVHGSIAYVYESGAVGAGQIAQAFNQISRSPWHAQNARFLSLKFEDKRQFTPLQAADIVAYEPGLELQRVKGLARSRRRDWILETISSVAPTMWTTPGRDQLEQWSRAMELVAATPADLLERRPASIRETANVPLGVEEFRERWRWFRRFRWGPQVQEPMEQAS